MSEPITKKKIKKAKKSAAETLLTVSAWFIGVVGAAQIILQLLLFKLTVSQYVSSGYTAAAVMKQLIPNSLLPKIFEIVCMYGGFTVLLYGACVAIKYLSSLSAALPKPEAAESALQESEYASPFMTSQDVTADVVSEETTAEEPDQGFPTEEKEESSEENK